MEEQRKDEAPFVGMRVKEETLSKIVLEWWEEQSVHPPVPLISLLKRIFSPARTASTKKEWDINAPAETITVDLDSQHATRIKQLRYEYSEHTDLNLREVSRVRIQMEELGHHFRLYLESPNQEPFQVSIAFINSSYSPDALIAHGRKIGKALNRPVVQQHTDLGHLIAEETLQV
jgi:hypothetical protein